MIYHLSIDARNPERVARVLAELFGGTARPFPPVATGSWIALACDDRNSGVEVYPRGTGLAEAPGDADVASVASADGLSSTHFAMATNLGDEDVYAIARREGWPAKYRKRGGAFGVIEMWLEGDRMVEVLTAPMQAEYLSAMTIENYDSMLASGRAKAHQA